ncbi:SH3 domain-containing protein, partial [Virgibacillus salexigens]|uniref:SH3 domain-containing protein n=1 Tax=Virgibacillus massiliensis TaxID=1462526 RepID=UPI0018E133D7
PESQTSLKGIGVNDPTYVYQKASTGSKVLKSYDKGSVLQYKSFTSNWYQATVYINGKPTTGYIHVSDVENFPESQTSLKGIGVNDPTYVYQKASTGSKVLKSYDKGSVLQYKSFTSNWYQATVYINGKPTTGYIHVSDVENSNTSQEFEGFALDGSTNVYSKASINSSVIKTYRKGSYLRYNSLIPNWYQATVYVNGKPVTGYINKLDVINIDPNNQISIRTLGLLDTTNVYINTQGSKILKTYPKGSILEVRTFSKDWYQATVYINNEAKTGYISTSEVEVINPNQKLLSGYSANNPTAVYSRASKNSEVLKRYSYGSDLKFNTFSNNWYETNVYKNGKRYTGYIHRDDVAFDNVVRTTKYNLSLEDALEMQMKVGPQTDQPYAYVSKTFIDEHHKVTANALNVRRGPGVTYNSIGQLTKGTSVTILEEVDGWYIIEFVSNKWVYASPDDVLYYLDPTNFINDPIQQFQFLDLSKPSGATVQVLNNFLRGKGQLEGKGKYFLEAGLDNGINDLYLISHSLLETGNGNSRLANGVKHNGVTVYNMYGIGANDGCAIECGAERAYKEGWTTPNKAIIGGAKFIADAYIKDGKNTLYKMRWNPDSMEKYQEAAYQYATDIRWASKQIYTMYNLYQEIESYLLYLDIPFYNS